MNLYLANGTYVGTQAEARKLDKGFKPVTVPVDKEGLIAHLNSHARPIRQVPDAEIVQRNDGEAQREAARRMTPARDMSASAVLSRMDGPTNIDEMCETICKSSGHPLKRYAASVACAFARLADGVR